MKLRCSATAYRFVWYILLGMVVAGANPAWGLAQGSSGVAGTGLVTVGPKGVHLLRDGVVWTPHGVVMVAFESAPSAFPTQPPYLQDANTAYYNNAKEFAQMVAFGADTVRIMVSQPGSDPQDPNGLYAIGYVNHVRDAVRSARAAGLNVIVNVQDESPSGDPHSNGMPDAATSRAWQTLAPLFNNDTGILYEIFNEPGLPAIPTANWATWKALMDEVIATVRATGSTNVILADGLQHANTFAGMTPLSDSAQNLAYAVHPYFHSPETQITAYWDTTFGTLASTAPMVVTEWYPGDANAGFWCDANTAQASLNLLQYLQSKGIGLTAFAYDFPGQAPLMISGSVAQDYFGTPTTFLNTACTQTPFGPGTLLRSWYRNGNVPNHLE